MKISIFTDEFKNDDIVEALDIIQSWDMQWVDFRNRIFGKPIHALDDAELKKLRALLDERGLRVACIESSLAKVHLPDETRQREETEKLEGIIRAADALDCRLVRSFFYWQPKKEAADETGTLHERPDRMQQALSMFEPLVARAREAGLTLAFENCGVATWEVKAFINALGGDDLGLAWDVRNGWDWDVDLRGDDEAAYIRDLTRLTHVIHVKGYGALPGRQDYIPYDRILPIVAAEGFDGPVSIETHNSKPEIDNVKFSKQVLDHLHECIPAKS